MLVGDEFCDAFLRYDFQSRSGKQMGAADMVGVTVRIDQCPDRFVRYVTDRRPNILYKGVRRINKDDAFSGSHNEGLIVSVRQHEDAGRGLAGQEAA